MSKIMSKMTHVNNKNTNNCFQIGAAVLNVKHIIRNCIIFHWYFHETPGKTPGWNVHLCVVIHGGQSMWHS